jgi:hypothetical protein
MQAYEYLHHIHLTRPLQAKQRCTPNLATSVLMAMSPEAHFHLHPPCVQEGSTMAPTHVARLGFGH